jgi:hypothetical protein
MRLDLKGKSTNLPDLRACQNCSAFKFAAGWSGNPATATDRRMAFDSYRRKRDPQSKHGPFLGRDEKLGADLGQHVASSDPNYVLDDEDEVGEEEQRALRRRIMNKLADVLASQGKSDEWIGDMLRDFPRNGLERLGGAIDEDFEQVLADFRGRRGRAHDQRTAQDARNRESFHERFPSAARIDSDVRVSNAPRPIGMDGQRVDDFNGRFPSAARIGVV